MSRVEATAIIFLTAFKALPKNERCHVLTRFLMDRELRNDLIDLALIEKRRREPSRPWQSYLKTLKTK